jgi:hypothetical protein
MAAGASPGLFPTLSIPGQRNTDKMSVTAANKQVTGNAALYYAYYCLSRLGWQVTPTLRNAQGVDLLAYLVAAPDVKITVQTKGFSDENAARIGTSLDTISADFWIVVTKLASDPPVSYVLTRADVLALAKRDPGGKQEYWLDPARYRSDSFRERWDRLPQALTR